MTVLTIFMFESQLMQMPGPRDIIIFRPAPAHFLLRKSPRTGHTHFGTKAPGCPGGMVTGQIDTCIIVLVMYSTLPLPKGRGVEPTPLKVFFGNF